MRTKTPPPSRKIIGIAWEPDVLMRGKAKAKQTRRSFSAYINALVDADARRVAGRKGATR